MTHFTNLIPLTPTVHLSPNLFRDNRVVDRTTGWSTGRLTDLWSFTLSRTHTGPFSNPLLRLPNRSSINSHAPWFSRPTIITATTQSTRRSMASEQTRTTLDSVPNSSITLLFVEMGVGYDQHGLKNGSVYGNLLKCTNRQDVTAAAMRACRDAISSNSIPAFRRVGKRFFTRRLSLFECFPYFLVFGTMENERQ
ncbi:hypothetical protein HYC85_017946 [Camellia sinensis]|uniref:Uncharacterized protein n=1 Tax=Camellia sinensis TaxID=4442 RepID=A0A7J7GSV4_CAMSI|nr:hypothetical protein HYC85_017946 [Camellia sinensis]